MDPAGVGTVLKKVQHTWDAGGNLTQRFNVTDSETENFQYDFLDRLLNVSGAYSENYTYNQIGNLMSKGGQNYTYDVTSPHTMAHAVRTIGSTTYQYDANGNMTQRVQGGVTRNMGWDVENRLTSVTEAGNTTSYFYDGDGKRVKKVEGPKVTTYVNKYYERVKDSTTDEITLYYYLGDRLVALKKNGTLRYVVQDHLTGTSTTWDSSANMIAKIAYFPFGAVRPSGSSGTIETEIKFTGQRLDSGVDLYYYGARYYDANIGRFISADSIVPNFSNPQTLNRYSYVLNNPVRFTDPTGNICAPCLLLIPAAIALAPNMPRLVDVGKAAAATAIVTAGVLATKKIREESSLDWLNGRSNNPEIDTTGGGEEHPLGKKPGNFKKPSKWWWKIFLGASISGLVSYTYFKGEFPHEPGGHKPDSNPHQPGVSPPTSRGSGGVYWNTSDKSSAGASQVGSPGAGSFGQGAGIIGGISGGASGIGTDEAGNSVFLVSIDGEAPIWVTKDNADSMRNNGEVLVPVAH